MNAKTQKRTWLKNKFRLLNIAFQQAFPGETIAKNYNIILFIFHTNKCLIKFLISHLPSKVNDINFLTNKQTTATKEKKQ